MVVDPPDRRQPVPSSVLLNIKVHKTKKMSRNICQRSNVWPLTKASQHIVFSREEGVFVLTKVFVYSADTVSWTTDSCRWCLFRPGVTCLPLSTTAYPSTVTILDIRLPCNIFVLKQQASWSKSKKTIGKGQWNHFLWNPWKDWKQTWQPTQGTPFLFSNSPWGFYIFYVFTQ